MSAVQRLRPVRFPRLVSGLLWASVLLALPAGAKPYSDGAILKQLGLMAGQAVACGLDDAKDAQIVAGRAAASMGMTDAASIEILANAAENGAQEGCRPLSDEKRRAFIATWSALKRKASVE